MWNSIIDQWKDKYGISTRKGVAAELLEKFEQSHGALPKDLKDLLSITNGLSLEWLTVFPIWDPNYPKETWDDIARENDLAKTKYLERDPDLLREFLVFAEIGGNACGAFHRRDLTIWYEDEEELSETDLRLEEFLESLLKEIRGE